MPPFLFLNIFCIFVYTFVQYHIHICTQVIIVQNYKIFLTYTNRKYKKYI